MNICFVYKEDYPWDVRVEKIINTLVDSGNSVTLICKNINQKPAFEKTEKFEIYRLPNTDRMPKLLSALVNAPLWLNPFWLYLLVKVVISKRSEVLIVRDLPLMLSGIIIARLFKRKVIFDMAECYPEMYRSAIENDNVSLLTRIYKNPSAASLYEYICAKLSDHIFVMINESRNRLISKGINSEKISIVSNTPIIVNRDSILRTKHESQQLRIVYLGFLTKIRGIDLTIRAIREFIDHPEGGNDIRFDVIGKGSAKTELEMLVKSLNLEAHVFIHGWLDHEEVKRIVSEANIGSLTYKYCSHWNNTIPNKLFDYMLSGLPVLTTNITTISRIVNETNCGLCTDSDKDIAQLTKNLIALKQPDLRSALGQCGQDAVLKKYNWDFDSKLMLGNIQQLLFSSSPQKE